MRHDLHHRLHRLDGLPLTQVPSTLLQQFREGPARAYLLNNVHLMLIFEHAHAARGQGERLQGYDDREVRFHAITSVYNEWVLIILKIIILT